MRSSSMGGKSLFKLNLSLLVVLLFTLFFIGEIQAANVCTPTISNINFGNYDTLSSSPTDSQTSVTVSCTASWTYNVIVAIGPSQNPGGFNPRQMKHGTSDYLGYNLYQNSSRTNPVWGDGTQGTSTYTIPSIQKSHPATVNIYGRATAGQDLPAGSYTDSLTLTIYY
jgi:spore coat protein U-like protein